MSGAIHPAATTDMVRHEESLTARAAAQPAELSRRGFLGASAATAAGAFVLGFTFPEPVRGRAAGAAQKRRGVRKVVRAGESAMAAVATESAAMRPRAAAALPPMKLPLRSTPATGQARRVSAY